jgi:hypothetical protein
MLAALPLLLLIMIATRSWPCVQSPALASSFSTATFNVLTGGCLCPAGTGLLVLTFTHQAPALHLAQVRTEYHGTQQQA